MKPFLFSLIALLLVASSHLASADGDHEHTHAPSEQEAVLTNEYCPVMPDEKVDPSIYVEYEGKRVYLCCNRCRRLFLESPEGYLAALPQFARVHSDETSAPQDVSRESHAEAQHQKEEEKDITSLQSTDQAGNERAHDHATDHGDERGLLSRVVQFGGRFHPVLVHFPIALAIVALLAEGLFAWTSREFFRGAGRFCIIIGAVGGLFAAPLGWAAASGSSYPSLELTLEYHRWLGTGAAALLVACAVLSEVSARIESRACYRGYVMVLVVGAVLTGIAGHLGATLVYGPDHFLF